MSFFNYFALFVKVPLIVELMSCESVTMCRCVQLHLEAAAPEPKEAKEREVDWFAEHGDSAPTNTSELAFTAQVTQTSHLTLTPARPRGGTRPLAQC